MDGCSAILALIWRPAWPPLHVAAAGAALAALAVFGYARGLKTRPGLSAWLLAMRLAIIAALVVLLMGPSEIPPQAKKAVRPRLCVMLDTSESMLTTDCSGASRLRFAQSNWLTPERLRALAREYDLDFKGFDTQLKPLTASSLQNDEAALAGGRGTQLADCLTQALLRMPAGADGQAMLMITDGHDSADQSIQPAAALAKSRHIAIHTVCLGGNTPQRDIALLAVPMQEYMLAKEPGEIMVKVYQVGFDQGATTVHLRCGDEQRSLPVQFNGRRVVEMKIPIKQDQAGQYEYAVHVDALDGEVESNNNEQSVFCNVTRERIKVLLVEGQPYWDTKFLAQALRKDERIELTQITQVSGQRRETIVTRTGGGTSPKIPESAEELAKYDVVILGREIEQIFNGPKAALLGDFVSRQGGHVIFARGMPYDSATNAGRELSAQLVELEPVTWGQGLQRDLALSLTSSGKNSPWFSAVKMGTDVEAALARLPGFSVMPKGAREKAATVVLLRARPAGAAPGNSEDGEPALVSMSYGRGEVVAVLGEGLWQWSLLEKQKRDLAGFYDAFWSNLVRWLAMGGDFQPGQQVSLKLSRSSVYIGDPLTIDVVFKFAAQRDLHPAVLITDPAGKSTEVALHRLPGHDSRFRTTINPSTAGVHRVVLKTPGLQPEQQDRGFSVYDVSLERLETNANPMAMSMLAEHTGGEAFKPNQADLLIDKLQRRALAGIVPTEPEYVWDQGVILFLLLLWAGLEWIIRRKAGLL